MKSLFRKLRKLRRDPEAFIKDSKLKKYINGENVKSNMDTEPRVLGTLNINSVTNMFQIKDKMISNLSFSTLVLADNEIKQLSRAPIIGELLENKDNFIGFREKNLFVLRFMDDQNLFYLSDVYEEIVNNKAWHSGGISAFKNIVLIGKYIKYAEFFRSANVNVRIIAVLNESNILLGDKYSGHIDHLICDKKFRDNIFNIVDVSFYSNTTECLKSIEQKILQAGDKPFDYLIPITGEVDFIPEIDELNKMDEEIHIKFGKMNKNLSMKCTTFDEYIDKVTPHICCLLMKESWMQRYALLVSNNDIANLLKIALKDGAKVNLL